jgi:formylglycine-generating enzyme required for sulfatase activity
MASPRIFVSHSHVDDAFGKRLVGDLRARLGEDAVWYDASGGLHGGDEWWTTIRAEITARDVFIVVLSPDALASVWVPREMNIAYFQHAKVGKRLIPVFFRPCEPPADWQLIHGFDFADPQRYEQALVELLNDLGVTQAGQSAAAPSASAPARDPRAQLAARLTGEIHTAFGREAWAQVVAKTDLLCDEVSEAMTPQLWRERGVAAQTLGDDKTSLEAFVQALKADPYDLPTLRAQAQNLERLGRLADAEKIVQRAQALAPLDDVALQLGLLEDLYSLAVQQQRWDVAQRMVADALRLAVNTNDAHWQTRQVELEEARVLPQRLRDLGYRLRVIGGVEVIVPPVCDVPAGPFTMGSDKQRDFHTRDEELPQHQVTLGAYQIGTHPMTVAEYACAVRAGGATEPQTDGSQDITWQQQLTHLDHPVVYTTWFQAVAYAVWLARVTGERWRLPTEAEWEKAARGTDGRIYPWGNGFDKARANTGESGIGMTAPVGSYPQGASPCGAQDMAGTVLEWCSTLYRPYPYRAGDGREDMQDSTNKRVLRGGSWGYVPQLARAACRYGFRPDVIVSYVGVRLVVSGAAGS